MAGVTGGGDEDDGAGCAGGAIGQGVAAGEAGGDVEGEEGFAAAEGAVEEGDAALGETVLPEPGDG